MTPSPASRLWLLESVLGESCKIRFRTLLANDSESEDAQELALDLCTLVSTLLPVIWTEYPDLKGPLGTRLAVSKLLGLVYYHIEAGLNAVEGRKQAIQYLNSQSALEAFGEQKARQLLGYLALDSNADFLHELKRIYDSLGDTLIDRMAFYAESLVQVSGVATPLVKRVSGHEPPSVPTVHQPPPIAPTTTVPAPTHVSAPKKAKTKEQPYFDFVIDGSAFRSKLVKNDDLIADIVHGRHSTVSDFFDNIRARNKGDATAEQKRNASPKRGLNVHHDSASRARWSSQDDINGFHFTPNPSANPSINSSPPKQPFVRQPDPGFMERNERSTLSRRAKPKEGRRFFTDKEQMLLVEGYREFPHQWAVILSAHFGDSPDRTSQDLKDKFRNLYKKERLPNDVMVLAREHYGH